MGPGGSQLGKTMNQLSNGTVVFIFHMIADSNCFRVCFLFDSSSSFENFKDKNISKGICGIKYMILFSLV